MSNKKQKVFFSFQELKFKIQFKNIGKIYIENSYFIKKYDINNESLVLPVNINRENKSLMYNEENELNSQIFLEKKLNETKKFKEERLADEVIRIKYSKFDHLTFINEIVHNQKNQKRRLKKNLKNIVVKFFIFK